ncbi:MAG: hypothetical protein Q7T18_10370 [Sedimentisphaerales bacterium]|nr:hypothetical protein [Sedimentisphaerales bacterium]
MGSPTIRAGDWVRLQQVINTLWSRTTPEGTSGFVGRDAGAIDVTGTTISGWTNDTWTEVNLSGVLPKGTKAVLLRVAVASATVGNQIACRTHGYTGSYVPSITAQAANVLNRTEMIVPTNGLQSIDIKRIGTIDSANSNITVLGWWT